MLNTCKKVNEGIKDHIKNKINQDLEFNFEIFDKMKYFASDANAKGDYYCNYVMLLYGINKKLFPKEYNQSQ